MNFFKLISVFICLISCHTCFGQSTLYFENFSTNTGKGHIGTSVDTTGVGSTWKIDPANFVSPVSGEYFKVLGGVFESYNTDATQSLPIYWYSKTVSISGYSNVTLSIDLTQISSNSTSGIEAFYSIDGGAYVSFGSLIGSTLSGTNVNGSTVSVSGLLGSNITIRVNHWGTSSTPYYRHDNVSIIGYIPVNYYSKSSGNLNELSNWGTNADGTGTVPSNFTSAAQTFHIRNNSSPTIGAAWTVSGTGSKIIVGDGTNSCDFTIPAAYAVSGTIDVSNNGTLSIAHLTTNPTLGSLATGSTVEYKGAGAQTIANASYHHLKLSTSGAKTLIAGVTSIAGNLTTSGTATTATVVGLTIGGNLNIGDGSTFTNAGHSLTVTGTTTIGGGTSGTLTVNNSTGTKTFTGLVTLSSGSTWNNSGNSPITFKGGITKLGVSTFTSGSAAQTFSTNNQTLAGALTISSLTITSITLTASNNLTVSTLTTDASAVLDMGTSSTFTVTTASANSGKVKTSVLTSTSSTPLTSGISWGGTVEYASASSQTLMQGTYNNLIISGGGEKTLSGNVTIGASGVLTLTSGLVTPSASTLTIDNLAVGAISGGSTTSFVNGAIKWKINTTVGSFVFPVGASGNYYPFTLTNPTRGALSQYITVSASASNSNGSNGPTCVSSISSSEYWTVALTTANLSGATISLGRTAALGSLTGIGQASTSNGAYASLAGIVSGTNINTSNTITTIASSGTNYFAMVQVSSTAPTITTPTSASVSTTTVTLGGNITSLNCSNIIERGIYYSTTNGFTDGTGTKVSVSSGPYSTGVFTIPVTGLVPNTVYYYKAFATNSSGSSYTTQGTFTTTTQTFPVTEDFESDPAGALTAGSTTTSGSFVETGSWDISNGSGGCGSDNLRLSSSISNQWYFTPRFFATAGKIYTVSYKGKNTASSASVSIYLCSSQSSVNADLTTNYFTSPGTGSTFATETSQGWLCTSSGTYSFGFKVSSGGSDLQLDCFSINETTPVTITWDGSSNTDWSTAANWSLDRIPNSTDIIIIPSGVISGNYPLTVPNGSFNSLSLTRGSSGTTTIGTTTFSGNVTLNSSFTSNTITFNGTTSIGGNLAVGTSGNNFNFTVNGATNVNGTFTLGAVNTAVTTTVNNPITVVGAFTMGNNSNHATTISYSNSTTKAITASNSGSLVFYGTVNYTASSGDQIIMKSQYNGALNATNGAKRYMEGELDLNSSLTMSSGDWYCGSSTTISISGTQGTDGNVKLSNSPYKGSGISGRWQGLFVASDLGSIGANDLITSISFYIDEKFSDRAYNNFTIKAALIGTDRFTQLQPSLYWPFFTVPMTTVFSPKNVTTINQSWNTHSFDVPFSWDGVSTILIEITFNNLAAAGGSGLAPDGTSDDKVAYIGGAWGNNIIVQTSSANSNITTTSYGSNSNYKNVSMFNAANGPFNINITNNWLNSGANFYHLRNTVTFDGNSNQQVTTRGDNYFNYVVNNTYNDGFSLTLNDDCEVENNATFQDGVIQTGSNKLVLMSSDASKLLAYSNASYVKGTLRRFFANNTSTYAFPLGKGYSSSTYFLSDVINSNLVGVNYLDGTFIDGFPTGYSQPTFQALGKQLSGSGVITRDIKRLDQAGYTQLDPNQQPTGGSYSLKMYAENYTLGDWIDNHQCIMKRPTGSNNLSDFNMAGTIYADDGLGRMVSQHYLLSTNLTSFSEFAAGLGNPVALPIQLVYFGVKRKNTYASLEWKTGTELNNDYFSVERSKDGINFKQICKVKGSGTSSHEKNYLFIDSFPFSGLSYYRLKQVDYDAKFEYSPIKAINFDFSAQNDFIIYPNPLENNDLEFIYSTDNEGFALIQIIEPLGRVILSKKEIVNEGRNYFKINLKDFPRGSYLLLIQDELGNQIHRKFVH